MQHLLLNTELLAKRKNERPTSNIEDCTPSVFQFYNLMELSDILIRRSMFDVQIVASEITTKPSYHVEITYTGQEF